MAACEYYDVILVSLGSRDLSASYINIYNDGEMTELQMESLLRELPVRVLKKAGEFHAKRLAEALERCGSEVRLIQCPAD